MITPRDRLTVILLEGQVRSAFVRKGKGQLLVPRHKEAKGKQVAVEKAGREEEEEDEGREWKVARC